MSKHCIPSSDCSWEEWHIPLACDEITLQETLDSAAHLAADQDDIPLIVQLVENPRFEIPWVTIFNGAVNLESHDCIHALLGRGLLPKDEAFVIGFTMGSTNQTTTAEQKLYSLAAKHLYPGPYKFTNEEIAVFEDAVHLGYVSDCQRLDKVDFAPLRNLSLKQARYSIGLEVDLLTAYFNIEKNRYPKSLESQRLL